MLQTGGLHPSVSSYSSGIPESETKVWAGSAPSEGPEGGICPGLSPRLAEGRLLPVALHVFFPL